MKSKRIADAHAILGVAPGASASDVKRAYRRRARLLHPDIAGSQTTSRMAELNLARDAVMATFPRSTRDLVDVPVDASVDAPAAPTPRPKPPDHEAAWEDYWATWTKAQAAEEDPA